MKSQMVETKKNFELKLQNATKKSKAPERETCPALTFNSFSELRDNLNTFCQGYDRVDLVHEDVLNFAFVHIDDSHIPTSKAKELNHKARFEVHDHCPSKLFAAKDISVQNIDGNVMFIVHLDKTSKNGYLMKELPTCGRSRNEDGVPYLPRTEISVKVYEDLEECCEDTKEFSVCKREKCTPRQVLHPYNRQPLEYLYTVRGSLYSAEYGHVLGRRRRLLMSSNKRGQC